MKPGIMVLLVFEAITAMVVASGVSVRPEGLLVLAFSGALASGGSSAINHYLERERDVLMSRTESRPVATGRIEPRNALCFGIATIGISLLTSYFLLNFMTMFMILLGALSYIFLYTLYLKPRTHWNIVIGGVAGVFPALAGWAAATGFVSWPAIYIGAIVFLWTPPHFWGLSMKFKDDYVRAGYPMISAVKNEREVINWIVYSSIPLLPFSLLPLAIPTLSEFFHPIYYGAAAVMGLVFIWVDVKMLQRPTPDNAFRAFLVSLPYLFVIFGAMIASAII